MDTNNKILGIIFEIDNDKYSQTSVGATTPQQINRATMLATKTIMVFNEDTKKHECIDLSSYSDNAKETQIQSWIAKAEKAGAEVRSYFSTDPILKDSTRRITNQEGYLDIKTREEVAKNAAKATKKKYGVKATAAVLALAIATTLSGCASCGTKKEEVAIESNEEYEDWLQYFQNAPESLQKQLFDSSFSWIVHANGIEDWEKVTLTEEQMKEYGFTSPECLFGFTADEAYALALRFNDYSKDSEDYKDYRDKYIEITGGNHMDLDKIDNLSESALAKIQTYYFLSEKCDLNIEKIITFTEQGQAKIDELETLFREFNALIAEEKETEAKEKMAEIKSVLLNCAHDVNFDKEAKAYILRTFAPTANRISQMHEFKDTIEIEVYDEQKNTETTLEVETDLFDDITNRTLYLGFAKTENVEAFDSEAFLKTNGIKNASNYTLLLSGTNSSIADMTCSDQNQKLEKANEYIALLRNEYLIADDKVNTTYYKLTEKTTNADSIVEFINEYIKKHNIYPKNDEYFTKYAAGLKMKEYYSTHGVTQGKPGDTIKTETKYKVPVTENQLNNPNSIVLNHAGEQVTPGEALEEARKENENITGITDASTPEASEKADQEAKQSAAEYAAMLDNVFNATYNKYYGKDVYPTSMSYDPSWAASSNSDIVANHKEAMQSALIRKSAEEKAAKENQEQQNQTPDIDEEFKDAETSEQEQEAVPSVDNTTTESTTEQKQPTENTPTTDVIPGQQPEVTPEIDYEEGFEDFENIEIEGDIIIGDNNTMPVEPSPVNVTLEQIDSMLSSMTVEELDAYSRDTEQQAVLVKSL